MTARLSQYTFVRPTELQPIPQRTVGESNFLAPVGETHSSTIERQESSTPRVTSLFGSCGPLAVLLTIAFVIIDPFNAVFGRVTRPHIFVECHKGLSPSLADGDSASAVVVVSWVVAPCTHVAPYSMFRRVGFAVGCGQGCGYLTVAASATERYSPHETTAQYGTASTAQTLTVPSGVTMLADSETPQDSPPSDDLPGHVFDAGWNYDRISFIHDSTPFTGLVRTARQHQLRGRSYSSTAEPVRQGDNHG